MPIQYATMAQFLSVYSLHGVDSSQIPTMLQNASSRLTELLAPNYTTPFTATNLTARTLTIDLAFYSYYLRTRKKDDSSEMRSDVFGRINTLMRGQSQMVYDDGTVVPRSNQVNNIWSNTQDYNNVFDVREPERQRVDPDQVDYYEDRDT